MSQKLQSRREFMKTGLAGSLALAAEGLAGAAPWLEDASGKRESVLDTVLSGKSSISTEGDTRIRIFSEKVRQPVKLMLISDTHLFMSDSREDPYRQYSKRMAGAYNHTRDFQTLERTDPAAEFEKTLEKAREIAPDALFILGDLVSYPSEAAVEWAKSRLDSTGIPYYYTNGNHDWHYEGMEGTEIALREEWTRRRLAPLFRGENHLLYTVDVMGVKVVMLDNSIYEILPEQLQLFRKEMRAGTPSLMMSHIPLYAPGFPISYGCGHPDWNARSDRNFEIERRPRWPESGHSETTFAFWNEVVKSHRKYNLLATFAGHVHRQSSSVVDGWPQFTLKANLSGAYSFVEVLPMTDLK